jgi:glycosyltransferase involved in cell wall biosynthesis
MPELSVVIITFNEERNIDRCLNSVKDVADDIVVVDSFSTDRTEEICRRYGVNFIQRKWEGYSAAKNFGNSQAKYDWILSLDADEALSNELKQSILEKKKEGKIITASFNRITNYCGKWIRHCGWYPDIKVRIFDRRIVKWSGIIHERLLIEPRQNIVHLKGNCLHYSYYSAEEHYRRAEKYSAISAQELYNRGKKVIWLMIYLKAILKFIHSYFIQLGFLDGAAGYTICRISAYATFLKYKKLRGLWLNAKS